MTFATSTSPARSAARQVQVDRRRAEQAKVGRAVAAGEEFLKEASREEFVSPREFFQHVVPDAEVDQFTAQVAFDRLTAAGKMDFQIGKGIRAVDETDARFTS